MKKFMMIALITMGLMVVAVPESNAGVSIGIGFGFPVGYCGFPTYPYGYYPYAYPYAAPFYRPVVYYSPIYGPYYWWHGHRIYYRAHRR